MQNIAKKNMMVVHLQSKSVVWVENVEEAISVMETLDRRHVRGDHFPNQFLVKHIVNPYAVKYTSRNKYKDVLNNSTTWGLINKEALEQVVAESGGVPQQIALTYTFCRQFEEVVVNRQETVNYYLLSGMKDISDAQEINLPPLLLEIDILSVKSDETVSLYHLEEIVPTIKGMRQKQGTQDDESELYAIKLMFNEQKLVNINHHSHPQYDKPLEPNVRVEVTNEDFKHRLGEMKQVNNVITELLGELFEFLDVIFLEYYGEVEQVVLIGIKKAKKDQIAV